jgi:hypothetical protein
MDQYMRYHDPHEDLPVCERRVCVYDLVSFSPQWGNASPSLNLTPYPLDASGAEAGLLPGGPQ